MPAPRFWSGQLDGTDFAPGFTLPNIAQASIAPGKIGKTVLNKTGSTIPAGQLVFVSSFDVTGVSDINLAAAQFGSEKAQYVTQVSIPNNGSGAVGISFSLTGQNTNAGNVGDPIWLSGTTPGGYTLTKPSAANTIAQLVGHISVKSATVGVIAFELLEAAFPVAIGANEIQAGAIGAVALSPNLLTDRVTAAWSPVVQTTGTTPQILVMPQAGTVNDLRVIFTTGLAINGTNFTTFAVNNLTQSLLMTLSGSPSNTTFTGGTAIAANLPMVLALNATPANLVVAKNDVIAFTSAAGGTLGANLAGIASIGYVPS
jgi:hypothetical protein